jgi:hypothetical protein
MKNSTLLIVFFGFFVLYIVIGKAAYNMSQKVSKDILETKVKIEKIEDR